MKRKKWLILCAALVLVAAGIGIASMNRHTHGWDVENLTIRNDEQTWKNLTSEEAIWLAGVLDAPNWGAKEWQDLVQEIYEETGSPASYYQFTGSFVIPEGENVQGTLTALIIAGQDEEKAKIWQVIGPVTNVTCSMEDVLWKAMGAYWDVQPGGETVRLSASGYLEMLDENAQKTGTLSNTLRPTYTVTLPQ